MTHKHVCFMHIIFSKFDIKIMNTPLLDDHSYDFRIEIDERKFEDTSFI